MGNFQGFNCHVQGLLKFLSEVQDSPEDPELHATLTAWMQIRFVVWWARVYFSPLEIHCNMPPVLLPGSIDGSFETTEERRVNVLNIMCESHRLNCNHILKYWVCSPNTDDDEATLYKLNEQSEKLDLWLLYLPINEQPSGLQVQTQAFHGNEWNNTISFQSHDAALNFAYYVLARTMQCTGAISRLRNRSFHRDHNLSEEQSWTRLLLQIAKGTNMQTSVSKNSYTIGFSGLLLAALLRCQDLSLGLEIQKWLEALHNLQPTEEGAFPIYQTLGVANMVNHQRNMGREIYGVSQLEDDGGGFPKFTAYNSQSISSLLLHGVCKISGEIFTECVSIEV
ncbi:hypothetical protein N7478_003420 [Penicillium angulare]|uniref:uncharacterized protein n=1 Tax=Penicillium angulare TaxID=116970 RepID=UPI002541A1BD|nr:uncharacterized protein N7478_003420 [Penicillium angulare]KAJ5287734.1 hypothetical protein N7478_003420 [Penicillium angulare]